ncbi:MAG: prolyl oligopeptidase family serine peptidase [Panacagrimonas sp.]
MAHPQLLEDPYLWLEEIEGQKALDWVRAQNAVSQKELEAAPRFQASFDRLLAIYDSDARIPEVELRDGWLYNFWRDARHARGVWRRTTQEQFRRASPAWETILDLDALAASEKENWVWKGAECLYPDYRRCLLKLSRGGADAHVIREFDIDGRGFVAAGFELPEAKHEIAWRDSDHVLVATDTGKDSLTSSGYPRIVREWKRGTPISTARALYEGQSGDVAVGFAVYDEPGRQRQIIQRAITFFEYAYFLRSGDHLAPLPVPADADLDLLQDQLILRLRSDWTITGHKYAAGSLIAMSLVAFIEGQRDFVVLFEPSPQVSLDNYSRLKNGLLLNQLDRVRGRVTALRYRRGRWTRRAVPVPESGQAEARALNAEESDQYLLHVQSFTTTPRVLDGVLGRDEHRLLKQQPAFFDARGLDITQHEAVSRDGTRVPYFEVGRTGRKSDGQQPTLLYAYGGFEVSLTPGYYAAVGAAWLEQGGTYVLANIRGGGEFGPAWHQSAVGEHRQRAYDDFAAVAEDLIKRGVTSPGHLGIQGGSNGGLLVGVAMTQRPDLYGAVVCQVPLLDMRRYHRLLAGASWMSEYGDPDDPAQWAFLSRYSPYQNARPGTRYPRVLLTTSTRDDRVHPGHARKMTARLLEYGQPVLYYENIEGGHGGSANNRQKAYMGALAYTFLWKELK